MTDIFREVDEDLRRERAQALWKKYGNLIVGLAALVVVGTAAWVGWHNWQQSRAAATGDRFVTALQLLDQGKRSDAESAFNDIANNGTGSYPALAALAAAGAKAANSDVQGAVAAFDAIAGDGKTPSQLRDVARLRAALLLADSASLSELETRIGALAVDPNPFRHSAREILGLAAWRTGDLTAARKYFGQILADRSAPQSLQQRVTVLLSLIQAESGDPATTTGNAAPDKGAPGAATSTAAAGGAAPAPTVPPPTPN